MPFKPPTKKPGYWLGLQNVRIRNIEDRKIDNPALDEYDMALDVVLDIENGEYTQTMQLFGTFLRENDGSNYIRPCGLLRSINDLCDVLGFAGGVDIKGEWVDENDKPINDIGKYLMENYVNYLALLEKNQYNLCAYLYQSRNKKDNKLYTRVWTKLFPNTKDNREEMVRYIDFCKGKGYIVEDSPDNTEPKSNIDDMSD